MRVLSPKLEYRDGQRAPHLYPDGSLCLFYPRAREWNNQMWLARTTVPWTAEWLFHYEI